MTKKEMKTTGVMIMIMIMLGFSQARYNPLFVQTRPTHVSDKLNCRDKCTLDCSPLLLPPFAGAFLICYFPCMKKCHNNPIDVVHSCKSDCALTKSINANSDARDPATDMVDSCVQECHK
ncbi:hypothetical protein D0Y65_036156 [Glycine soja]|uniref:Protein TAP1 n=1 Tax=Glycine soja TaxID=3848 RepID=A0A0B2RJM5_GLYSO|nr:hypothetical protein glysoja_032932 [Glycine soja]RZB71565.1 hypothetical protein D0Y65_036156 [Glycine soja]